MSAGPNLINYKMGEIRHSVLKMKMLRQVTCRQLIVFFHVLVLIKDMAGKRLKTLSLARTVV